MFEEVNSPHSHPILALELGPKQRLMKWISFQVFVMVLTNSMEKSVVQIAQNFQTKSIGRHSTHIYCRKQK